MITLRNLAILSLRWGGGGGQVTEVPSDDSKCASLAPTAGIISVMFTHSFSLLLLSVSSFFFLPRFDLQILDFFPLLV